MNDVFITSTGHYLPGAPVENDQIEEILGEIYGKPSRLKRRILKSNGIKTRHYAIDKHHTTTISNSQIAAKAGLDCLNQSYVAKQQIQMLSCATSQGDMILPGFGSMVQADIELSDVELQTSHGICSSSMMALKSAFTSLKADEHSNALVIASELTSRLFKASHYEAADVNGDKKLDFNAEFLRFMLSDGAGSLLLETRPRDTCFRIDWIRGFSHADSYPVCMSVGLPQDNTQTKTWQDYSTYAEAEAEGALLIRQDVRLLENIVKVGVDGFLRLVDEGLVKVSEIDHLLCHYSSNYFRSKIHDMLEVAGATVPYEKWYSNLTTRGNTGCASILIMLDEFRRTQTYKEGDVIFCMVPESGRFNTVYMKLTVVNEINE